MIKPGDVRTMLAAYERLKEQTAGMTESDIWQLAITETAGFKEAFGADHSSFMVGIVTALAAFNN
jgi:hypothetical protein